jgi:hypothetical protein
LVHANVYGDVVSEPTTVLPLRNSTRLTVPSGSEAVAAKLMVAGAANDAPAAGLVRLTVGARLPDDGEVLGDGLDTPPVHATPLSAKLVGWGNGFGGVDPAAARVQSPCSPTLVFVWPVPMAPFQPTSAAVTAVVPV